jgi:hypothetical protein
MYKIQHKKNGHENKKVLVGEYKKCMRLFDKFTHCGGNASDE